MKFVRVNVFLSIVKLFLKKRFEFFYHFTDEVLQFKIVWLNLA